MKRAVILTLILFFFISGYGDAARKNTVNGFRYSSYDQHTRVVIDISGPVEFTKNRLANPDRLFFDVKNSTLSKKSSPSKIVDDGIINKVRLAQYDRDTVRIVLDIKQYKNYYAFTLDSPSRLVIDVYSENSKESHKKKKEQKQSKKPPLDNIWTVVIDPGHGGEDPGAVGPGGVQEKDIVLMIGRKLGSILESRHGMKVIYTRQKDMFIPLNDRTEIANAAKADLFISIHTNASEKRSVRGIETYFLNWTNNKEANRVAARENRISLKKMHKVQGELQLILQDLARKSKNEESMKLAYSVQHEIVGQLKKSYPRIEDLGVKYALFYVLIGAEMPAVLAEISFVSNHEEEKRMTQKVYRDRIAEALASGITSYTSKSTLIVNRVSGTD
ncbi:MAG: N-acetylmuramoyl-L-alanine amidase [Nitrospira sp.]|nr:N-acetylmuramoyl-L-alanine amidase [Nitrospira sp.]